LQFGDRAVWEMNVLKKNGVVVLARPVPVQSEDLQ
jgi:hypothetical protein